MDSIEGGCLCGTVRYTYRGAVAARRQCWCRVCQFLSCGGASTNLIVEVAGLNIRGELAEFRSVADSGHHMVRSFCPRCGTPLLSRAEENPHYLVIRAGTLDDPDLAAPEGLIWTASAPRWACLPADLPRTERQPQVTPWPPR